MAKIVIIENDPDIAPLVETLLRLEGYETVLVMKPAQALDTVMAQNPDLVYLDVRLTEEMDGFEVLRRIRSKTDVPVLMCSGLDVEEKCLKAGANAFLLKPFDFDDLLNAIKQAKASKARRS